MVEKRLESMTPEEKIEYWKSKVEANSEVKEKTKPIRSVFIPLGENYNSKFTVWSNNVQITKSRQVEGKWEDYQTINLSKRLLIELNARIPLFVAELEAHESK